MNPMSSVATHARKRRASTGKRATVTKPSVRVLGERVAAQFRKTAAEVVQQAHAVDVPVAILTDDNQVAWLHPVVVVWPTRTPIRRSNAP